MEFIYERQINYYETDRMGVVHHSNYIRFMEEARCAWLKENNMSFENWEENGITIPVLSLKCDYKYHVTSGDIINIRIKIKEYTSVRLTIEYEIKEKDSKRLILTGQTNHCFTNNNLKPINLKKVAPELDKLFQKML